MTRSRTLAILPVVAAAAWILAAPGAAQVTTAPVIKAKPVHTAKPANVRFEVLHMTPTAIQVRGLKNTAEIHTFSYSDKIRGQMQKLLDRGGYQYGDKVKIEYQPGTEVALKITGKPSKPL